LDSGEEGDGEVVRVQVGPQVSGGVTRSQPAADGG
jgi:predicted lipoprotein